MPEESMDKKATENTGHVDTDVALNLLGDLETQSEPLYHSLWRQINDLIKPPKLPALQLTSKPVAVKELWGDYRYGKVASPISLLIHAVVIILLVIPFGKQVVGMVQPEQMTITELELSPFKAYLPPNEKEAGGGGGGGDRSKEEASKGNLPKLSMEQLAPPTVVLKKQAPKLPVEPTVVVPPQVELPTINIAGLGDPLTNMTIPSSGTGFGGGIGTGSGGGVGSGRGGGVGLGVGGGIGGGVFRVGGAVSAPQIMFKVDPEYSEQARKAKYQGTVVLRCIVQKDGTVRDIKIVQSLGLGLDEKAVEAVAQWKFRPGKRRGEAVDVAADIEVTFRLL